MHTAGGGSPRPSALISNSFSRISSLDALNRLNFGRPTAVSGCGASVCAGYREGRRGGEGEHVITTRELQYVILDIRPHTTPKINLYTTGEAYSKDQEGHHEKQNTFEKL